MGIEEEVLSKIVSDGSILRLEERRVTGRHFLVRQEEYQWLRNHVNEYGVPHRETFARRFPQFRFEDSLPEPMDFYLDRLRKQREYKLLTDALMTAGEQVVQEPSDARGTLEEAIRRIYSEVLELRDHDWKTSGEERRNAYLGRAARTGGLLGIPTPWPGLDNITLGLQNTHLITVAGRPKKGKCVAGTSRILTRDGRITTLEHAITTGQLKDIQSYDEDTGCVVWSRVLGHVNSGLKEGYRICMRSGREVVVSKDHPFLTDNGLWVRVGELTTGNWIAVPRRLPFDSLIEPVDEDEAYMLGLFISEGGITHNNTIFSTSDAEVLVKVETYCKNHGLRLIYRSKTTYNLRKEDGFKANNALTLLRRFNLSGKKSEDKFLPSGCLAWKPRLKYKLLEGMFDGDGTISDKGEVFYSTSSVRLRDGLCSLLLSLDMDYSTRVKKTYRLDNYIIRIATDASIRFKKNVDIINRKKMKISNRKWCKNHSVKFNQEITRLFKRCVKNVGPTRICGILWPNCKKLSFSEYYRGMKGMSEQHYKKIVNIFYEERCLEKTEYDTLMSYTTRDIVFDRIQNIESIGDIRMYDLEVEGTHNFIVNDVLVHNSFLLVMFAVRAVRSGVRVLFVTMEMSADEILRRADAIYGRVPYGQFRRGALENGDEQRYTEDIIAQIEGLPGELIVTADADASGRVGLTFLEAKIRQYSPQIVLIDGVYLLHDEEEGRTKTERLYNLTRGLKQVARHFNIPIMVSTQMGRSGRKREREAQGANEIQWSDSFSQDADCFIELWQSREMLDLRHQMQIVVGLQREGPPGSITVNWDFTTMDFEQVGSDVTEFREADMVQNFGPDDDGV